MTFDPSHHLLPWAWQEVEGKATTVGVCWQQGREEGGEDVEWVCCVEDVSPPIQEIRLAVVWAGSGLHECVCSMAMWTLCVNCGMGCGLPVGSRCATRKVVDLSNSTRMNHTVYTAF